MRILWYILSTAVAILWLANTLPLIAYCYVYPSVSLIGLILFITAVFAVPTGVIIGVASRLYKKE